LSFEGKEQKLFRPYLSAPVLWQIGVLFVICRLLH
jgi:hypothetical protein